MSKIKPSIGDTIFVLLKSNFSLSKVNSVCCINFSTSSISALIILIWASLELIIALRDKISDSKVLYWKTALSYSNLASSSSFLDINFFSYNFVLSSKFSFSLLILRDESFSFDTAPFLFEIELFNSDFAFSKLPIFCFNFDLDILTEVLVSSTFKMKGFWSNVARTSPILIFSLKSLFISTIFPEISEDKVSVEVGIILPVADTVFLIFPFSTLIYSYDVVEIWVLLKL